MVREDSFLMDLIMRFPYLTYLWTRISPDQMTVDPVFVSSSEAEDVSSVIDLGRYVDQVFPLEQINKALEIAQGQSRLKIIIKPNP